MREVLLISHELRTPLCVLSGYLSLLEEHEFSQSERQQIREVMKGAVEELERTIEVLIDRERRVALAYGLTVPELVDPALYRTREEILNAPTAPSPEGDPASPP